MACFRFLLAFFVSVSVVSMTVEANASEGERPAAFLLRSGDAGFAWTADAAKPTSYEDLVIGSAAGEREGERGDECGSGCADECGGGCADECGGGCGGGCGWTVRAGTIALWRSRAGAQPSIQGYQNNLKVYDSADADLGMAFGPDISLSRCLNSDWDIEARFFQIDGWGNTADVIGGSQFSGYGQVSSVTSPTYAYRSRLYNVEANLRWGPCGCVPLLIGFRMLGLDDRFRLTSEFPRGQVVWVDGSTNNVLYGVQIGAEPVLWSSCDGCFRFEGLVKTGIYSNQAHQRTSFPAIGSSGLENRNGLASFVGEIGLTAAWQLNQCWAIRGGYELMWITNTVLAPDQAATVVYGNPASGSMYDKATAFYHGVTVSLERRF